MQSRTLDWKYFDVNIKPTHVMVSHYLLMISFLLWIPRVIIYGQNTDQLLIYILHKVTCSSESVYKYL
jgi:hypothetical protein